MKAIEKVLPEISTIDRDEYSQEGINQMRLSAGIKFSSHNNPLGIIININCKTLEMR